MKAAKNRALRKKAVLQNVQSAVSIQRPLAIDLNAHLTPVGGKTIAAIANRLLNIPPSHYESLGE